MFIFGFTYCGLCFFFSAFSKHPAVDTSNQAWQQAELSLSWDGLGMRSLRGHSPDATMYMYAFIDIILSDYVTEVLSHGICF